MRDLQLRISLRHLEPYFIMASPKRGEEGENVDTRGELAIYHGLIF